MKHLTDHQQKVLNRLRAGEHIYFGIWDARYRLSGSGRAITSPTFRVLREAGVIRSIGCTQRKWVATNKGDGHGT